MPCLAQYHWAVQGFFETYLWHILFIRKAQKNIWVTNYLVLHHAFCDIKGSGRNDVHAEHGMSTQMPATPTRTRLFALLRGQDV